jgi:hypothetical protein
MSKKRFLIEYELDYNRTHPKKKVENLSHQPPSANAVAASLAQLERQQKQREQALQQQQLAVSAAPADNFSASAPLSIDTSPNVSIYSSTIKKRSILSPIVRSPCEDDPKEVSWQTSRKLRQWKQFKEKNTNRLSSVLIKLEAPSGFLSSGTLKSSKKNENSRKKNRPLSPYLIPPTLIINPVSSFSRPNSPPSPHRQHTGISSRATSPSITATRVAMDEVIAKHQATTISSSDSFARAINGYQRDIENFKKITIQHNEEAEAAEEHGERKESDKPPSSPFLQPRPWDNRFIFQASLTPVERPSTATIHLKHQQFLEKMEKYKKPRSVGGGRASGSGGRDVNSSFESETLNGGLNGHVIGSSILSASAPAFLFYHENSSHAHSREPHEEENGGGTLDDRPSASNSKKRRTNKDNSTSVDDPSATLHEVNEPPSAIQLLRVESPVSIDKKIDPRLLIVIESFWNSLVATLHRVGGEVLYQNVYEIAILREPPETIQGIIGYIALLMGLKPIWKTMKAILLKEFTIFQNFIREVSFFSSYFLRFSC